MRDAATATLEMNRPGLVTRFPVDDPCNSADGPNPERTTSLRNEWLTANGTSTKEHK
jgi:hypothetical protein